MALYDANFHIEKGEVVGFLGPNGAGKSTTMNMLCGYLEPSWGSVRIAGIDMAENPMEAKRHIGYLPEIPPLYMDMTVEEQLCFACDIRGLGLKGAELKDYVASLCERTDMLDTRSRLIRNLSKGYRQRTAVTQLLVGNPEILVLDEPTVGLDPRQVMEFRKLFTELGKDHTIIISSHILSEIASVCSRIFVFSEGELIADGEPEKLSDSLTGRRMLEVEIAGPPENIIPLLSSIEGVISVLSMDDRRYRISHTTDSDIRSEVYRALKSTDFDLLMMKKEDISLENIYLKLTEEQGAGE